jgi:hypothetical protein
MHLNKVGECMDQLKEGATSTKLHDLSESFDLYQAVVLPHLQEEEEIGLLLARAYFTPQEIGKIVGEIMKNALDVEMGSFMYFQGVARFRKVFMPQEGIPFFVWFLAFKKQYASFLREFVDHSDAIKNGTPPKKEGNFWRALLFFL